MKLRLNSFLTPICSSEYIVYVPFTRSENEHLLSLVKKQAQKIIEDEHHIKDLEEKEKMITKSVMFVLVQFYYKASYCLTNMAYSLFKLQS